MWCKECSRHCSQGLRRAPVPSALRGADSSGRPEAGQGAMNMCDVPGLSVLLREGAMGPCGVAEVIFVGDQGAGKHSLIPSPRVVGPSEQTQWRTLRGGPAVLDYWFTYKHLERRRRRGEHFCFSCFEGGLRLPSMACMLPPLLPPGLSESRTLPPTGGAFSCTLSPSLSWDTPLLHNCTPGSR